MKKRIDVLVFENGLAPSREKAKTLIIAGQVKAAGHIVKSPSEQYETDIEIEVTGHVCPYVSRGGLKLEKAIREFRICLENKTCMDIGASTGGFTDCMLQNGAAFVYAVDVGYGQFDWKLRNDKRIQLMERTNARYLERQDKTVEFVSVDVSFISLKLIFPAILRLVGQAAQIVTLIKPQFEAGKEHVGKKGVVRDAGVHETVIENVIRSAQEYGLFLRGLTYSPIQGPTGNIEYLAFFSTSSSTEAQENIDVGTVVQAAHKALN